MAEQTYKLEPRVIDNPYKKPVMDDFALTKERVAKGGNNLNLIITNFYFGKLVTYERKIDELRAQKETIDVELYPAVIGTAQVANLDSITGDNYKNGVEYIIETPVLGKMISSTKKPYVPEPAFFKDLRAKLKGVITF